MSYIYPAPGVAGVQATLSISVASNQSDTGLNVPALQDVTVNAANDVFTWTQLDETAKKQIATTSTNSLSMNIVLDQPIFFGTGDDTDTAAGLGIFGLSINKNKIEPKSIISCIYTISRCTRNWCYYISFLPYKRINQGRFSNIWFTNNCNSR